MRHLTKTDTCRWVSPAEAMDMTGLSRTTIWRAYASGDLPAAKVGRRVLIRLVDLDRWINRHRAHDLP